MQIAFTRGLFQASIAQVVGWHLEAVARLKAG
jgi:hypothetical protein